MRVLINTYSILKLRGVSTELTPYLCAGEENVASGERAVVSGGTVYLNG